MVRIDGAGSPRGQITKELTAPIDQENQKDDEKRFSGKLIRHHQTHHNHFYGNTQNVTGLPYPALRGFVLVLLHLTLGDPSLSA